MSAETFGGFPCYFDPTVIRRRGPRRLGRVAALVVARWKRWQSTGWQAAAAPRSAT